MIGPSFCGSPGMSLLTLLRGASSRHEVSLGDSAYLRNPASSASASGRGLRECHAFAK